MISRDLGRSREMIICLQSMTEQIFLYRVFLSKKKVVETNISLALVCVLYYSSE